MEKKITDIKTRFELASLLHVKLKQLCYVLYGAGPSSFYESFDIPKKSGGVRKINAPTGLLKYIQSNLAKALAPYQEHDESGNDPKIANGFIKGKSIITNAEIHRNKRYVLNVDLKDFFDHFHFGRVCGYFEKNRRFMLPHDIAVMIAQITCFEGVLPQGAPTSPVITNLMCQVLDIHILKLAKQYHLDYTRYADDLTFSTNDRKFSEEYTDFLSKLEAELKSSGFEMNREKTRLQACDARQSVTGLIVNEKLAVQREFYKETRAMADSLYKNGKFLINGKEGSIKQLEGRFAFIDSIDHYNSKNFKNKHSPTDLPGRERQYRYFLFYKYFFGNEKPVIITEGKTDEIYIKAALRSLYLDYPDLIKKDADGNFVYSFDFLNKKDRLQYFLGLNKDGGDGLTSLIASFISFDKKADCYKYLSDKCLGKAKSPVILLFDNENDKQKPLHKLKNSFQKQWKSIVSKEFFSQLDTTFISAPFYDRNLYVAAIPKDDPEIDADIETLFLLETLEHKIEGKSFDDKMSRNDPDHYYGKNDFAIYISKNYQYIDFKKFRRLLDTFVFAINDYKSKD